MIDDLARRQIANWIPLAALAAGFGWQMGQSGLRGLLYAGIGTVAGFAVFLIFYLLGGMGGGDVKLMAGFGALLGNEQNQILWAALWTAVSGGAMALVYLSVRSLVRRVKMWMGIAVPQEPSVEAKSAESIPYAPAITAGAL